MPGRLLLLIAAGTLLLSAGRQASLEVGVEAAIRRILPEVPGLSIAVSVDNRVVYARGFGTISIGATTTPTADTQFRLASVAKPITAAAVFRLVEGGAIDLDRAAREYCPVLAGLDGVPTVRHLLLHQSGLRHSTDAEDETIAGEVPRLAAALARIVHEKLRFPPGRRTLYTSWGYAALGCVIEEVSRQSYAEFVSREVLATAGMTRTTFDHPDYSSPDFSPGFRRQGSRFVPARIVDTRFKRPSSGIISTANDLVRFAGALFDHRLLPERRWREMLGTRAAAEDARPMFTHGWTTGSGAYGTPVFSANGSMEGTTAVLVVAPERRVAVALLTNRERYVPGVLPAVQEALRAALDLSSRDGRR